MSSETAKQSNEQRYFDALRLIAKADSPEWLRRNAEKKYGITPDEAMEYAIDNLKSAAVCATQGRRRPKT